MMASFNDNLETRNIAQRNAITIKNEAAKAHEVQVGAPNLQGQPLDCMFGNEEKPVVKDEASSLLYRRGTADKASFDDFEMIRIIGQGAFGKVYLVHCNKTGKYYAMKCIRKDLIIKHNAIDNIESEKHILNQVNHPFIVGMDYVFQKAYRIYFVMDYIQGGELKKHLTQRTRFGDFQAKFYCAQIAIALGYLHKSGVIYRDLKPENILLDKDGYIKLADFGLAKIVSEGDRESNSFCGTPEYLSPEMIDGSGHDHTLDWWALGIITYEMLIGIPPFFSQDMR